MKNSNKKYNKESFLSENISGNITSHHKEFLGTDIPKDYFVKSKYIILNKIKEEKKLIENKQRVIKLYPNLKYFVAASLILLLGVSIWLQNKSSLNNNLDVEHLSFNDNVLIDALLVEENQLNEFTQATLVNEVIVKAELSEQKLEKLILDTMVIEDSLLDDYLEDQLVENIVL